MDQEEINEDGFKRGVPRDWVEKNCPNLWRRWEEEYKRRPYIRFEFCGLIITTKDYHLESELINRRNQALLYMKMPWMDNVTHPRDLTIISLN